MTSEMTYVTTASRKFANVFAVWPATVLDKPHKENDRCECCGGNFWCCVDQCTGCGRCQQDCCDCDNDDPEENEDDE